MTYLEIKGGRVIIAQLDNDGNIIGPYNGTARLTLTPGPGNPRTTAGYHLGTTEKIQLPSTIAVNGDLIIRGKPVSKTWAKLASSALAGSYSVVVDADLGGGGWEPGAEVIISPTGYDPLEHDVATIANITVLPGNMTRVFFKAPLEFYHHADTQPVTHGTRKIRLQADIGLLTRNVQIRGSGQGEDVSYKDWNAEVFVDLGTVVQCGNNQCEQGEHSINCPKDCRGPAYEWGAAIYVSTYKDIIAGGFAIDRVGKLDVEFMEMKYFGQNDNQAGLHIDGILGGSARAIGVSFNKGYDKAIWINKASGVKITDTVAYRMKLPGFLIESSGSNNDFRRNLLVVGIFRTTHRGATLEFSMAGSKTKYQEGMFKDMGRNNIVKDNVVAGSERSGFMSVGQNCDNVDDTYYSNNEAHTAMAGFFFSFYGRVPYQRGCVRIASYKLWSMYQFGIFGEIAEIHRAEIVNVQIAECKVHILINHAGMPKTPNVFRGEIGTVVQNSLLVGKSTMPELRCQWGRGRPKGNMCRYLRAYCTELFDKNDGDIGVMSSPFYSGLNHAPAVRYLADAGEGVSDGYTEVIDVTFSNFGKRCVNTKYNYSDFSISSNQFASDTIPPTTTRLLQFPGTDVEYRVRFSPPEDKWIVADDCVDMDCDAGKNWFLKDEDGTLLGGSGGTASPRGELFGQSSTFGSKYAEGGPNAGLNVPWWSPNLPIPMRSEVLANGSAVSVNVKQKWLSGGFGHSRTGCTYIPSWQGWNCPEKKFGRLAVESLDADNEMRRISPVAFASDDGYVNLMNGFMDHGWCFSYTCLQRMMMFYSPVRIGSTYTVFFSGAEPMKMNVGLTAAKTGEKVLVKIFCVTKSVRRMIKVNGNLVEDVNMVDGKLKRQLVRDGTRLANDGAGGYTDQELDLNCACKIGDVCKQEEWNGGSQFCDTPSNSHGANRWNRGKSTLEIVLEGKGNSHRVEIDSMAVVQASMGVPAASVDEFYKQKDTFISSIAGLLGIPFDRIFIVDVVAGNGRRAGTVLASFEIAPSAKVEFRADTATVDESAGTVSIEVIRTTNLLTNVTVLYEAYADSSMTAVGGMHFIAKTGSVFFISGAESATIQVSIVSVAGYISEDKVFAVKLGNVTGGELGGKVTQDPRP